MSQTSAQRFSEAAQVLVKAEADIRSILIDPTDSTVLLYTTASIERINARLNFLSGGGSATVKSGKKFGPVTHFMGEKLELPKKVSADDLSPKENEKQAFIAKVNRKYKEIPTMDPEAVILNNPLPEDILILRGVAKRAGVEDFEEREIDVPFMEEIIAAIKTKQAEKDQQDRIDSKLAKNKAADSKKSPSKK